MMTAEVGHVCQAMGGHGDESIDKPESESAVWSDHDLSADIYGYFGNLDSMGAGGNERGRQDGILTLAGNGCGCLGNDFAKVAASFVDSAVGIRYRGGSVCSLLQVFQGTGQSDGKCGNAGQKLYFR